MLELLAASIRIATRMETRTSREKLAEQRRLEDEYFYQGRKQVPGDKWRNF